MVTLAPEMPGVLEAIRELVRHGVICSIGHSDATWEEVRQAVGAGAGDARDARPARGRADERHAADHRLETL